MLKMFLQYLCYVFVILTLVLSSSCCNKLQYKYVQSDTDSSINDHLYTKDTIDPVEKKEQAIAALTSVIEKVLALVQHNESSIFSQIREELVSFRGSHGYRGFNEPVQLSRYSGPCYLIHALMSICEKMCETRILVCTTM